MRHAKLVLVLLVVGATSLLISQSLNRRKVVAQQKALISQVITSEATPPNLKAMRVEFEEVLKGGPFPAERISTRRAYTVGDDGSISIIDDQYTHEGELYFTHRKLDLSGGIVVEIIDTTKSITAYRAPEPLFEDKRRRLARWNPAERCSITFNKLNKRGEPTRTEKFLGYDAFAFESESVTAKTTIWAVPDLDCLEVRRLAQFADADGRYTEVSDLHAVRIRLGSEGRGAFEIPLGFDHLPPSEVYLREAAYRGVKPNLMEMRQFVRLDEHYQKTRYIPN